MLKKCWVKKTTDNCKKNWISKHMSNYKINKSNHKNFV